MKNYQLIILALVLSGCASNGGSKQDAASLAQKQKRAEIYFQGLTFTPVTEVTESCQSTKSASWKTLIGKASACAKSGQWSLVEQFAYELAKMDIDSPWGLYFYSLAAEGKNDLPRALWMIETAIKKSSPNIALFRYQKGRLLWLEKPSEAALKEVEVAVKADPSLVDAHVFLGEARLRSWELSVAEKHFEAALQLKSSHYEAVRGMAECKRLKGNFKDSIPYFSKAQSMKPTVLSTRLHLASAYEQEKQPNAALATYRSLRESLKSGLIKDKPDFDVNEKIRSLEGSIAAAEAKQKSKESSDALSRQPAQKGEKR